MKMRCTTAVALLCGLTCFQPLASAAPTGHGPVFKNCSAEKQSFVLSTIKDALDLSALSSHAIDVARHGRNLDAFPETSALRDPNTAQDLIARWFGEETRPTATNGEENMAYIQGLFNRMHALLANNSIIYRCDTDMCYPFGDNHSVYAFVGNQYDWQQHTVFDSPELGGLNLCEKFWETTPTWDEVLLGIKGNDSATFRDTIAVKTLIHEMAHELRVGQGKQILDTCLPGWGIKGYGGSLAQALAWMDTGAAMHNADNYAGFAIDVGLGTSSSVPEPKFDPTEPFKKDGTMASRRESNITAWSTFISRLDAFPTVTVTTSTRYPQVTDPPHAGEKELEAICGSPY